MSVLKAEVDECPKGRGKGTFLHSTVSSPLDCSKDITIHPLADLFIPTPTQLLLGALSHSVCAAQRLFVYIPTIVYSQVHIYTAE